MDLVEVLFPTPWWNPALRRKRLLVDDAFVADVARVLCPGGMLYTATDVADYAEVIDGCVARCDALVALTEEDGLSRRPACTQQSRREWACERDGVLWTRRFWTRA